MFQSVGLTVFLLFYSFFAFAQVKEKKEFSDTIDFITIEIADKLYLERGSCYMALRFDEQTPAVDREKYSMNLKDEKAFVLEALPTEWREVKRKYSCVELKLKLEKDGKIKHKIREESILFVLKHSDLKYYARIPEPEGFMFCIVEVPAKWKIITENELVGDSITIVETKIVTSSKITKSYGKQKINGLGENQLYFEQGDWSRIEQLIKCSGNYTVRDLQIQLNKVGYNLTISNEMNQATKEALLDFQRKHNLREGYLDTETLNELNIEY